MELEQRIARLEALEASLCPQSKLTDLHFRSRCIATHSFQKTV